MTANQTKVKTKNEMTSILQREMTSSKYFGKLSSKYESKILQYLTKHNVARL